MKIPVLYEVEKSIRAFVKEQKKHNNEFVQKLKIVLENNFDNNYPEHYRILPDMEGAYEETKLAMPNVVRSELGSIQSLLNNIDIDGLNNTYQMLNDDYSKDLLVQIMAYRLLGHTRFHLPLADKNLWKPMVDLEKNCKLTEYLDLDFWKLNLFDLNFIGYDIRLFFNTESIFVGLGLKEYCYDKNGVDFKVENGDYVIDGGACYGDTALYFAHDAGESGKVFSFEFLEENLNVFDKNLELNPKLKDRITIYKKALWENSQENLYIVGAGPGTACTMEEPENYSFKVKTKSIDDLVGNGEISRVDFIKFDIEGAELEALKGCKETIKKFKPKLATCLYHRLEHFISIPKYIKELIPEYDLYIDHHTMSEGETVMYAVPPQK